MNKVKVFALAIIVVAVAGCSEQPATTSEITAVEHTLDTFATALETQDLALFSGVMSHDPNMVCFGFGPGERWVGYEALETAIRNQMDVYEDLHTMPHDRIVTIGPNGQTAWFSETLDWDMMADGQPVSLRDTRFSGVMVKVDGAWKIAQFQLATPNDAFPPPQP